MSRRTKTLLCPLCGSDEICTPDNTVTYVRSAVVPTTNWSCYECGFDGEKDAFVGNEY